MDLKFHTAHLFLLYHFRRFDGGTVVVHASAKVKGRGRELQLPSMQQLTSKSSSQHFLLRILKVVIQLRDAARAAAKKASRMTGMCSLELPRLVMYGQIDFLS